MPNLSDAIVDFFPPTDAEGVPLGSTITIDFDRAMDTERLEEDFFVQGPDTDQFVGPGLVELRDPDNVSQGDLDDFLRSPGYTGIVEGAFEFEVLGGGETRLKFTPTRPLFPLFEYTVTIADTKDFAGNDLTGMVYWKFSSGSGSIEELPATISTSVLAQSPSAKAAASAGVLGVVKTTPTNRSVEHPVDLKEITVQFDKDLDPASVSASDVTVKTFPATDHPNASVQVQGDLAKTVEVAGKILKIKI